MKRSFVPLHDVHCRLLRRNRVHLSHRRRYDLSIANYNRRADTDACNIGQYHWVAALCPESTKSAASWATGWISVGGQIVLTASAAFAAGLQAQSLININNDNYVGTRWQGMLFYWAILAYAAFFNIWGMKAMPHINLISG